MEVGRMAESTKGGSRRERRRDLERERDGECERRERRNAEWRQEAGRGGGPEKEEGKGDRGEEPSNLHPATAPDLGRTNH